MPRVTITVPDKTPQPYRFQLDRDSVTLGRGSDNDIAIDCASISMKHAEMRRVPGGYELRDLGSTNGIKIHGERHQSIQLRNGIPVKLGDVSFDFLLSDEELSELAFEKPDAKPTEKPDDDSAPKLPPISDFAEQSEDLELEAEEKSPSGRNGCSGCAMIGLFLILATAAFVAGMVIRFQKDTGDSLIDTLKAKFEVMIAPAKKPPAAKDDDPKAAPDKPEPKAAAEVPE